MCTFDDDDAVDSLVLFNIFTYCSSVISGMLLILSWCCHLHRVLPALSVKAAVRSLGSNTCSPACCPSTGRRSPGKLAIGDSLPSGALRRHPWPRCTEANQLRRHLHLEPPEHVRCWSQRLSSCGRLDVLNLSWRCMYL